MKTYSFSAYRWERYAAHETIEAESPEAALAAIKEMDAVGDVDYSEYTGEAKAIDHIQLMEDDDVDHEQDHEFDTFASLGREIYQRFAKDFADPDAEINGGDVVEFLGAWMVRAKVADAADR